MNKITRQNLAAFLLATSLHVGLLLCWFVTWHWQAPVGRASKKSLQAFVYYQKRQVNTVRPKKIDRKSQPRHLLFHNRAVNTKSMLFAVPVKQMKTTKHTDSIKSMLSQGQKDHLLSALHDAIAQAESYPPQARFFHLTGQTTIAFALHPNGQISQIQVTKSSGNKLLDSAAVQAVKSISPFTQEKIKLTTTLPLSIAVDFVG